MRLLRMLELSGRPLQSASPQGPPRLPGNPVCHTLVFGPLRFSGPARWLAVLLGAFAFTVVPARAQTVLDSFHWVDFRDSKDAQYVTWVTRELRAEKWTAIREIGVQWDSALVLTSERATPQSTPPSDVFTVWSVSLSKHQVEPLLHGATPRILNWTSFGGSYNPAPELALVYDDCWGCDAPSTFFTTLYYSISDHAWRARWLRGNQAAALWSSGTVEGVTRTQVYGLLTEPPGRNVLATWTHNDYGKAKPAEDFIFEYSVDPGSGLEQTQGLSGDHAQAMELRLCRADPAQIDPALTELARGQDSPICREMIQAQAKSRPGRRPTITPPANNHGQSAPPPAKK